MKYNREINALRGLAVSLTIYEHIDKTGISINWIKTYLSGSGGVILFFVISGFVISANLDLLLTKNTTINATINFWIRRCTRIFPQAFLWIAVTFLLSLYAYPLGLTVRASLCAILNVYNFFVLSNGIETLFGPYWSLSVEEQFYIIFPLFLVLLPSSRPRMMGGLAILISLGFLGFKTHMWLRYDGIILGVIWYEIWKHIDVGLEVPPRIYRVVAVALLVFLMMVTTPFLSFLPNFVFFLIMPALSLILVMGSSLRIGLMPEWKILDWLGTRSYALYLSHLPIFTAVSYLELRSVTQGFIIALSLALAAFLAEATYRLIEEPIRIKGKAYASSILVNK